MYLLKKILCTLIFAAVFCTPVSAYADNSILDALNLAPFVPLVLDALMTVATGGYEYFVGQDGHGIIYVFIWIFLGTTILPLFSDRLDGSKYRFLWGSIPH